MPLETKKHLAHIHRKSDPEDYQCFRKYGMIHLIQNFNRPFQIGATENNATR
jgi:hypothetical protein